MCVSRNHVIISHDIIICFFYHFTCCHFLTISPRALIHHRTSHFNHDHTTTIDNLISTPICRVFQFLVLFGVFALECVMIVLFDAHILTCILVCYLPSLCRTIVMDPLMMGAGGPPLAAAGGGGDGGFSMDGVLRSGIMLMV